MKEIICELQVEGINHYYNEISKKVKECFFDLQRQKLCVLHQKVEKNN